MIKYIWLNPIVINSYNLLELTLLLREKKFTIVHPNKNHAEIVLNQYKDIKKNSKPILDQRCPLISAYFKINNINVNFYNIDPILISTAKELSETKELSDGIKFITTPCSALAQQGNKLKLKNTFFLTWDSFCLINDIYIKGKKLDNSPVPLGFFDKISDKILKLTGDFHLKNLQNYEIIEGLYCENGCHNGDGVNNI